MAQYHVLVCPEMHAAVHGADIGGSLLAIPGAPEYGAAILALTADRGARTDADLSFWPETGRWAACRPLLVGDYARDNDCPELQSRIPESLLYRAATMDPRHTEAWSRLHNPIGDAPTLDSPEIRRALHTDLRLLVALCRARNRDDLVPLSLVVPPLSVYERLGPDDLSQALDFNEATLHDLAADKLLPRRLDDIVRDLLESVSSVRIAPFITRTRRLDGRISEHQHFMSIPVTRAATGPVVVAADSDADRARITDHLSRLGITADSWTRTPLHGDRAAAVREAPGEPRLVVNLRRFEMFDPSEVLERPTLGRIVTDRTVSSITSMLVTHLDDSIKATFDEKDPTLLEALIGRWRGDRLFVTAETPSLGMPSTTYARSRFTDVTGQLLSAYQHLTD